MDSFQSSLLPYFAKIRQENCDFFLKENLFKSRVVKKGFLLQICLLKKASGQKKYSIGPSLLSCLFPIHLLQQKDHTNDRALSHTHVTTKRLYKRLCFVPYLCYYKKTEQKAESFGVTLSNTFVTTKRPNKRLCFVP
jgi:hypothetical protein